MNEKRHFVSQDLSGVCHRTASFILWQSKECSVQHSFPSQGISCRGLLHLFHLTLKSKMHREIAHTSAGCRATHKVEFKGLPVVEM